MTKKHEMNRYVFQSICSKYTILPTVALENDLVRKAVVDNDPKKLEQVLQNEF